jgi:hypothetical protein
MDEDDGVQFEIWSRITSNHLLRAADGFREMALLAPEGAEVGRMIHNIDMLLAEAELWQPDGTDWPNGDDTAIVIDFLTRTKVNQ